MWLALVGCFTLVDDDNQSRFGQLSSDYLVTGTRAVAVRAWPPAAPAGSPRTAEVLVLGPSPEEVRFDVCGLAPDVATEIVGLACFGIPEEVDRIGVGNPVRWDVPDASYEDCVPFDTTDTGEWPGAWCTSLVPLRATVTTGDGEVSQVANMVVVPDREVPTDAPGFVVQPDPTLPVTLEVQGEVEAGAEVELLVRFEERGYELAVWWVTAGELLEFGRTRVDLADPVEGRAYNRLRIPADHHGPLQVAVVLQRTDLDDGWVDNDLADDAQRPTTQPGWALTTLEVP